MKRRQPMTTLASLRVLSCPRAPRVPAELRLNWVNVACIAVGDRWQSYWLLEPVTRTAKSSGVFGSPG